MTLETDLDAAKEGRASLLGARLPVSASLVSQLLERSWVAPATADDALADPAAIEPRAQLKEVARDLETALFQRLFEETDGDFEAMAARLLEGDPAENARRVRLRFNQLGLRVRDLRR